MRGRPSYPRRRVSRARPVHWIPACAGMTKKSVFILAHPVSKTGAAVCVILDACSLCNAGWRRFGATSKHFTDAGKPGKCSQKCTNWGIMHQKWRISPRFLHRHSQGRRDRKGKILTKIWLPIVGLGIANRVGKRDSTHRRGSDGIPTNAIASSEQLKVPPQPPSAPSPIFFKSQGPTERLAFFY